MVAMARASSVEHRPFISRMALTRLRNRSPADAGEIAASSASSTAAVGAVVITHANAELALACLDSLAEIPAERRVVVVNDPASMSAASLAALETAAVVIANTVPRGYGENANAGVAALPRGLEMVVIANDDVLFRDGSVTLLATVLAEHDDVAVVGPAIRNPDDSLQTSSFAFPSIASEVVRELILPARIAEPLGARYARPAPQGQQFVDWVLGAVLVIRLSAFEDVGGFDSRYFLYSEETALCRRLRNRGWLVVSDGGTTVTHFGQASTRGRYGRMLASSRAYYIKQHWRASRQFVLLVLRPVIWLWNHVYIALAIAVRPSSRRAKLHLLRARWTYRSRLLGKTSSL